MHIKSSLIVAISLLSGVTTSYSLSQPSYNQLDRNAFNRLAQETNTPLFWQKDANKNHTIKPNEVLFLWGMRSDKNLSDYVSLGQFTQEFDSAYQHMVTRSRSNKPDPDEASTAEAKRRTAVLEELKQARPTVIATDFSHSSSEEKNLIHHLLEAAKSIETLYLMQNGVNGLEQEIPKDDAASRTLFYRNHGPFCLNPLTEKNADCNALPSRPKRIVGVYPRDLQLTPNFCASLQSHPNSKVLTNAFTKVIEERGVLSAQPYSEAYYQTMRKIAWALQEAAHSIPSSQEAALKTYLLSAAKSFTDNDWYAADRAWAQMSAENSKWYLRIAPDEVYWDPCSLKAGFHLTLAKMNSNAQVWQKKIEPLKDEMEQQIATLAGPPYQVRNITFHLPDFIDIILNAGDSRAHAGATMGQSLPNTGPIANEGHSRTVAMTNVVLPDEASRTDYLQRANSLFCPATMKHVIADPAMIHMTTVFHEAAHNLGPAHEYKVNGKTANEIFGGQMASMLEELKAQTSAMFFTDWLVNKNVIKASVVMPAQLSNILWAFGHISRGMYNKEGDYKPYSQLAAIQVGYFLKNGAMVWQAQETAANGKDKGCFEVNQALLQHDVMALEKLVLGIKARGDHAMAEKLRHDMVDDAKLTQLYEVISQRSTRYPAMTFVYSIKTDVSK